ncbi:MAG: hypothetical protein HRT43_00330, partial [Campylobacteraceae bacterium]|nr:hypothetical protein [Campylobacteraceae bacterium]
MSIKNIIKINSLLLFLIIFSIFIINFVWIDKIQKTNHHSHQVTTIVLLKDNMIALIIDSFIASSLVELDSIKRKYLNYESRFYVLKNELSSALKNRNDIFEDDNIQKDYIQLINNANFILGSFEKVYNIQQDKLNYAALFKEKYPDEKKIRKEIREKIMAKNILSDIMIFNNAKYFSKEALFQYKDKKHYEEWKNEILLLQKNTKIEEFKAYLNVVNTLETIVFEGNNINKL